MLKKHSKIKLVIFAIIAILGILLCVCPFSIPSSTDTFNGFIPAINRGVELNGGVEATFSCTLKEGERVELEDAIEDAVAKMEKIYKSYGFDEVYVNRLGEDKVSVLVSGDDDTSDVFSYVEKALPLSITLAEASETVTNPAVYLSADAVKSVKVQYNNEKSTYGVVLSFTKEGLKAIETLQTYAEDNGFDNAYLYLGEIKKDNLFATVEVGEVKEEMFVSSSAESFSTSSQYSAIELSHNIMSGSMSVEIENLSVAKVTSKYGKDINLLIAIAFAIIVVVSIVYMGIRYGHLGLLGSMSMAFFITLLSFIIQSIPFIRLGLAGVMACLIAYAIAIFSICFIFEKIREEYSIGKKIHLACIGGFKKALWTILDSHFAMIFVGAGLWIFAPSAFATFGVIIIMGAILSMFTSLLLTRYFVKVYLPINSTKAGKLRLYRDKNVVELSEVEIIPEDQVNPTNEEEALHE